MGTIGGVMAHADPAGDYGTLALMLDATITTNKRSIAAPRLLPRAVHDAAGGRRAGHRSRLPGRQRAAPYVKFRRRLSDWAIVGVGAQKMEDGPLARRHHQRRANAGARSRRRASAGARRVRQRGGAARRRGTRPDERPARQRRVQAPPGQVLDSACARRAAITPVRPPDRFTRRTVSDARDAGPDGWRARLAAGSVYLVRLRDQRADARRGRRADQPDRPPARHAAPAAAAPTTAAAAAPTTAPAAPAAGGARGSGWPLKVLMWQGPTILNPHLSQGTKDFIAARFCSSRS